MIDPLAIFVVVAVFVVSFGIGFIAGADKYHTMIYNCRYEHNVHKCSMQPTPQENAIGDKQ